MSGITLEAMLARLYTDAELRAAFLASPEQIARNAGLCAADVAALQSIDRAGLMMAADSYAWKRRQHRRPKQSLADLVSRWLRRRG